MHAQKETMKNTPSKLKKDRLKNECFVFIVFSLVYVNLVRRWVFSLTFDDLAVSG